MFARLRARLTYANVVATLALFLALGGASYAAVRVGSRQIVNNSVRTQDLRNNDIRSQDIRNRTIRGGDILTNTITGHQVRESTLDPVPDADRLGGAAASSYRVSCPAGTLRWAGGCMEAQARPQATFDAAAHTCGALGRRLPQPDELGSFGEQPGIDLDGGGEWSSARIQDNVDVVSEGPAHAAVSASSSVAYRCIAPLAN
jgi:hypothetical protein